MERSPDQDGVVSSRKSRWATTVLGALLLTEGLGKLLDPSGYVAALVPFSIFPAALLWPVGVAWMSVELFSGAGLLIAGLASQPPRTLIRWAAGLGVCVAVAYLVLTGQAFARALEIENCTCFGVYLPQQLSVFVLLQDAYMIVYTVWQFRKIRSY